MSKHVAFVALGVRAERVIFRRAANLVEDGEGVDSYIIDVILSWDSDQPVTLFSPVSTLPEALGLAV